MDGAFPLARRPLRDDLPPPRRSAPGAPCSPPRLARGGRVWAARSLQIKPKNGFFTFFACFPSFPNDLAAQTRPLPRASLGGEHDGGSATCRARLLCRGSVEDPLDPLVSQWAGAEGEDRVQRGPWAQPAAEGGNVARHCHAKRGVMQNAVLCQNSAPRRNSVFSRFLESKTKVFLKSQFLTKTRVSLEVHRGMSLSSFFRRPDLGQDPIFPGLDLSKTGRRHDFGRGGKTDLPIHR